MTTMTCPSRDELSAFALGAVDDEQFEFVSEHLTICADCDSTFAGLEDHEDSVVAKLRVPHLAPHADEPELAQAMQALEAGVFDGLPRPSKAAWSGPGGPVCGDRLHEYELLGVIGEGGMGVVYRARHHRLGHVVALKILPACRRDHTASAQRFGREITAVGKLHHPNIVKAYDAGQADGMHFLVMELIDGVNLHQLVRQQGPLGIADACEIGRQAALGLEHAHEHGLVHRDFKPSNVLLSRGGEVKLLDLGLALLQEEDQQREELTFSGQMMGTLDYFSPEQATDCHRVDHRTDLYGLGCTLFKLLTGHAPFSGRNYHAPAKKILAHAEHEPPRLRDVRQHVPEALDRLIARLLAKDPGRRPRSAAEVAELLEPLAVGSDLAALAEQIVSPAMGGDLEADASEIAVMLQQPAALTQRENVRRRPLAAVAAFLIFVLMAAGVIITIRQKGEQDRQVEVPPGTRVVVDNDGNVSIELLEHGEPQATTGENIEPEDLPTELVSPAESSWIPLAPLVQADRDTEDASWTWDGETAEFGSARPIARISIPLIIDGSYELQTRVTIVQAKESTAIYLPVAGARSAVLHLRGDSGNTASPTATMQLAGLDPAPQPQRSASIDVGTEYFLTCKVVRSGSEVTIEVSRDEQVLFQWDGPVSQIAEVETMRPGTVQLQTAYYTSSRFTDLRLRMLSGSATPMFLPLDLPIRNFYQRHTGSDEAVPSVSDSAPDESEAP